MAGNSALTDCSSVCTQPNKHDHIVTTAVTTTTNTHSDRQGMLRDPHHAPER